MPIKLPRAWINAKLEDVCLLIENIQPHESPDTTFTYFDIGSIDNELNVISEPKILLGRDVPSRARQVVQRNDILFSTVRTYLRNIALIEAAYLNPVASTGFAVIRAADGVRPEFLFYQLLSDEFLSRLNSLQSGTSYPAVRERDVLKQSVRIAPTQEQKRIVTKLKGLLNGIRRGKKRLLRASVQLEHYRQSLLQSAVTGDLTADWRKAHDAQETAAELLNRKLRNRRKRWEEIERKRRGKAITKRKDDWRSSYKEPQAPDSRDLPKLPVGWIWATVDQLSAHEPRSITDGPFGSNLKTDHYTRSGPRVVRLQNVGDGIFIDDPVHISQRHFKKLEAYAVEAGDLVIRALGIPSPRACRIPASLGPAIVKADCIRFKVAKSFADPTYVLYALNSPPTRERTETKIHGIGRPRLNLTEIKGIALPLPPFEEQKEVVREVQRRLVAARRLAGGLDRAQEQAQKQRQSLLREAFAGKLVPQDPGDDPASIVLQRIKQSKVAMETEFKAMRKRPLSKLQSSHRRSLNEILESYPQGLTPEALFQEAGFKPSEVDLFYRELSVFRDIIDEQKPEGAKAMAWPLRARVILKLKRS
jgi:type I restriction enzyme, S subunit